MHAFNRVFTGLLALAWCGLLASMLLLVWDQNRLVDINESRFQFLFDISLSDRSEQILATVGIGALIALGLVFLAWEFGGGRRRVDEHVDRASHEAGDDRYRGLETRIEELQRRLEREPRSEPTYVERPIVTEHRPIVTEHRPAEVTSSDRGRPRAGMFDRFRRST